MLSISMISLRLLTGLGKKIEGIHSIHSRTLVIAAKWIAEEMDNDLFRFDDVGWKRSKDREKFSENSLSKIEEKHFL